MQPKIFKFEKYNFNPASGIVVFDYSLDKIKFREKLVFPKPIKKLNPRRQKALDRALFGLFLIAGISYYKTYCPKKIDLGKYKIGKEQASFWNKVYTKGLGQFFYENQLDFRGLINFPYAENHRIEPIRIKTSQRCLVPLGGGKDSIVVLEKLKEHQIDFDLSFMGNSKIVDKVAKISGKKIIYVKRQLSPNLFVLNKKGAYNGHIPISAYYAFILVVRSILYDYKYIILANEHSANYGNIKYLGQEINHQWSKSLEFENLFRAYVKKFITPSVEYFSLLRPWHEIKITQKFSKHKKYFPAFSSCNANFKITQTSRQKWCGHCPKCIFVWTILSPFVEKKDLIIIFGTNLYAQKKLLPLFEQLLGLKNFKPFECVGLPAEMKVAMFLVHRRREYTDSLVMKKFVNDLLPKIKKDDLNKLASQVFADSSAHNLPKHFKKLLTPKILILGFGREGQSSLKFFLRKKFTARQITVADKNLLNQFNPPYRRFLKQNQINLKLGKNYMDGLHKYDTIVKTAGIKLDENLSKQLTSRGVNITTNLNLFLSEVKGKIIGVTGTKGKSTTACLIYSILKTHFNSRPLTASRPLRKRAKVVLLGNIGKPFLNYLNQDSKNTLFVAEVSSYQLDTLKGKFDIGVMTSFFPEHLNYHGNEKNYLAAKLNLARASRLFIYPDGLKRNKNFIGALKLISKIDTHKTDKNYRTHRTHESYRTYKSYKTYKTSLAGQHNQANIAAAVKVAETFKIKQSLILKALKNFKPLGHRLEFAGKFGNINFYNDVLSTTPESTIAAINALLPQNLSTVIVGGFDRGLNYKKLAQKIIRAKIKNVIYWPHAGEQIARHIKKNNSGRKPALVAVKNMRQTVIQAFKLTDPGQTVLLSPAASSYDYYKNYEAKGNEFKNLIKKFGQNTKLPKRRP